EWNTGKPQSSAHRIRQVFRRISRLVFWSAKFGLRLLRSTLSAWRAQFRRAIGKIFLHGAKAMTYGSERLRLVSACLLGVFLTLAEAQVSPAAQPLTAAEVALLDSPQRQKILEEWAKKEGKVVWYTPLIVNQAVRPLKE